MRTRAALHILGLATALVLLAACSDGAANLPFPPTTIDAPRADSDDGGDAGDAEDPDGNDSRGGPLDGDSGGDVGDDVNQDADVASDMASDADVASDMVSDADMALDPEVASDPDAAADADVNADAITDGEDDGDAAEDRCDEDGDGFRALSCGGDDCDDNNSRVFPGGREGCDFADNDCDGDVNEGLSCTFYAHTSDELFLIDPFAGTEVYVTDVPNLHDFDTDVTGTLYGISPRALHRFDAAAERWEQISPIGALSAGVNGFAINSSGNAYATGGNDLFAVDLDTGETDLVGALGGGFLSSGDCVVDKNDVLFMTSDHRSDQDVLVRIDATTAVSTSVGLIGFRGVYGLTAAWGFMFGVTSRGEVLEIDPSTGRGRLLHVFGGRRWYGAASAATR